MSVKGSYITYLITSVFPALLFSNTTGLLLCFLLKFLHPAFSERQHGTFSALPSASSCSQQTLPAHSFLPWFPSSWPLTNLCLPLWLHYTPLSFLLFLQLCFYSFVCLFSFDLSLDSLLKFPRSWVWGLLSRGSLFKCTWMKLSKRSQILIVHFV